jgi:hypothetical protein
MNCDTPLLTGALVSGPLWVGLGVLWALFMGRVFR